MSFVDHYLPYFRQQLITRLLSAFLPFQLLFTESSCGDLLFSPHSFSDALTTHCPFCCVFVFSSLFIIQLVFFFFFCRVGDQSVQGLCCFIPGVAVGIP
jgi:hypothetical protein